MAQSIETKGFAELSRRLNRLSADAQSEVKGIIEFNAGQIVQQAKRNAPGAGSSIKTEKGEIDLEKTARRNGWSGAIDQGISYRLKNKGYKAEVFVNESVGDIAAWVEFGTGQSARRYLASVPEEWKELAAKYIRTGDGTIIDKPYLLPAYLKYKERTVKEIKAYIASLKL